MLSRNACWRASFLVPFSRLYIRNCETDYVYFIAHYVASIYMTRSSGLYEIKAQLLR